MQPVFVFIWNNLWTIGVCLNVLCVVAARRLFLWDHMAAYVAAMIFCSIPYLVPAIAIVRWIILRRVRLQERETID